MKTKKQMEADVRFEENLKKILAQHREQLRQMRALPWKGEDQKLMILGLEALVGMDLVRLDEWAKEHS